MSIQLRYTGMGEWVQPHAARESDARFGNISTATTQTRLCLIMRAVTRPIKAKAAVRSPVPIVYIMMRSIIEAVRVKDI